MKKQLYFIIWACVIFGCSKKDNRLPVKRNEAMAASGKEYFIRKGNHYADGSKMEILRSNSIHCEVMFDSTAIYESVDKTNQEDVNKLIGFSDCNTAHHENSARLGWSWNGHAVVLYAYTYMDKERMIKTLAEVPLKQLVTCSVSAIDNHYFFTVNSIADSLPRHCNDYNGERYKLFPYFGGDETAPHDIRIVIYEK